MAKWFTVLCCGMHGRGFKPPTGIHELIHKYVDWKGLAPMVTSIQSTGVTPTKGKSEDHTGEKAHEHEIHPDFETQGRHHHKSKPVADLGGARDARPPSLGQNFFIFMQFWGKILSNNRLALLRGWRTPSGNSWIRHWYQWS